MPGFIGRTYKGMTVGEDGWCIYYDENKKCTIYDNRPDFCRPVEGKWELKAGDSICMFARELYLGKMKKK